MARNGDAHLKNFDLPNEHPDAASSPTLAPLYDVVTITVDAYRDYRSEPTLLDRTLALKLNKDMAFSLYGHQFRRGGPHIANYSIFSAETNQKA